MTSPHSFMPILFAFAFSSLSFASVITIGSSFTPQQKESFWQSENGTFTFGFKEVALDQYILSIWVSRDVNETALWWANFAETPTVDAGANLTFTDGGNLQLSNSTIAVWSSDTGENRVSSAELLETGNLVLYNNTNARVWQRVQYLTDTLVLPNEGPVTGLSLQSVPMYYLLQSRKTMTSYIQGGYNVVTDSKLNLTLNGVDLNAINFTFWDAAVNMTSNFQILQDSRLLFDNNNYSVTRSVRRLTLDYDGNLRVYVFTGSQTGSWQLLWEGIDDKCKLGSPCGPFGLCEVADQKTNCICPLGYAPVDGRDLARGCKAKEPLPANCIQRLVTSSGDVVELYRSSMVEVNNFDYNYNYLDNATFDQLDMDTCEFRCQQDCSCMAASYTHGSSLCSLKGDIERGYLLMGYKTDNNTLFMKVAPEPFTYIGGGGTGAGRTAGIAVGVVGAAAVLVLVLVVLWCRRRRGENSDAMVEMELQGGGPVRFTYRELVQATKNFSELLGQGGFGKVYKGLVQVPKAGGGTRVVAVKVLYVGGGKKSGAAAVAEAERRFRAEVFILGKIHHLNLVNLLGFCASKGRRILVYEYVVKGSLDHFIFRRRTQAANSSASVTVLMQPSQGAPSARLPWQTRFSIALGTARGISYLHNECHDCILHCDIKPHNILLDDQFTPKVAGFGLAKPFPHREDHLSMSAVRGTVGYLAPEWVGSDEISAKADVYSFGMVLLELVRGDNTEFDRWRLRDWAFERANPKDANKEHVQQSEGDEDQEQKRVLMIGLWCIQHFPSMRPTMTRVVNMLEGTVPVEDPPYPAPINLQSSISEKAIDSLQSYSLLSAR